MPMDTDMVAVAEKIAAIFENIKTIREDISDIKTQQEKSTERLHKLELDQASIRALAADSIERGNRLDKLEEAQQVAKARLDGFDRRMTVWGALCAVIAAVFGAASGFLKSLWS